MSEFTHLHVHSHYSLLDGLGKITPLLERVKELGMDAIALTDHGVMYGMVEFVKAAKHLDIKPIMGVEAYLAPNGHMNKRGKLDSNPRHITLLAQNMAGYRNLVQLTTKAHLEGYYYKPRIDYELLRQHSDGLIVLSGCLNGDIARAITENRPDDVERILKWQLDVFGRERFYLEIQDHPHIQEQIVVNDAIIRLAEKHNVRLVATTDTHYIHPDDAEAQDVLLCVQTGRTVQDKDRMCMLEEDFSLKSPDELKKAWKDHPEALENTIRITEMCHAKLEFGVNKLPRFPLPKGRTADEQLRTQCLDGLKQRYGEKLPDDATSRLDYELDVIKKTGFASYFLIVSDFVTWAKNQGILVGPGRGSAAGSLVAFLMNITNLDPLAYNLLFERFLNPERISMPDIDLDFADDRRGEVIEYVRQKYGQERVAQIITFGTMAARAAVRDAGRALGYPYSFCDHVAKAIPMMTKFTEALETSELKELYDGDPQAKKLIDTARRLEGVCRHASTHAAGVVITDEPLTHYVPLQLSSTGEDEFDTVTQYAMSSIEALGLLKVDFLGLKNLTIIQNALKIIKKRYNTDISLDTLPQGDASTYQLLQNGTTTGVFQLESAGMKRYLKELKPTEFEDIISMVALYRPGPMDSIPDFIAAKHGRKKITYLHPVLKPILEKTYGIIVTQDQVLQIAREFAGFTYAEADILRKAVGKKIKALLDEQRQKFINGAVEKKKIDPICAAKVWDFIEPFARYGFNRAHAACYALIAYQTAYLKAHYPAEFMAALLTSDEGNVERANIEVAESLSLGIKVLPPDINESYSGFTVVDQPDKTKAIRFGMGAIKNVGHNIVATIITERKQNGRYKDLADLFSRVESRDLNRKSVESMARAGALDCIGERQQVLTNVEKLLNFSRTLHKARDTGQQGLFGAAIATPAPRLDLESVAPARKEDRLKWEKELLGMYVSEHPLSELHTELQKIATPLADLKGLANQSAARVAGAIARISKIITKSGQPMLFVNLEDMTGQAEVLVFPRLFQTTAEIWVDGGVVIAEGKVSDKDGETKILLDKVWPLSKETMGQFSAVPKAAAKAAAMPPEAPRPGSLMVLTLPPNFSPDSVARLKNLLSSLAGQSGNPVALALTRDGRRLLVRTTFTVPTNDTVLQQLRAELGVQAISFVSQNQAVR